MCVSRRSGGETVWFLSCGLLWILIARLQRYRTVPQSSQVHYAPSSNPLIQIRHESIYISSNVYLLLLCPAVFLRPHPTILCPLPACNCDPMGSISMQCHSNGTCHCRQGFVGYKCDKCEMNYFHNRATHQCEECPVCYGLVKKQVSLWQREFMFVTVCVRITIRGNKIWWLLSWYDKLSPIDISDMDSCGKLGYI